MLVSVICYADVAPSSSDVKRAKKEKKNKKVRQSSESTWSGSLLFVCFFFSLKYKKCLQLFCHIAVVFEFMFQ